LVKGARGARSRAAAWQPFVREGLGQAMKGGVDYENCGIRTSSDSRSLGANRSSNEGGRMALDQKAYRFLIVLRGRIEAEEGQAMVEYALILALVTIVSIAALQAMGISVASFFGKVNSALTSVAT